MSKGMKIIVVLSVLVGILSYVIYDYVFPVAEEIDLPRIEDIESIQIKREDINIDIVTKEEIKEIVKIFENAKPTRDMSIHDTPTVSGYFNVYFWGEDVKMNRLYMYKENNEWYLEVAYVGVYKLDKGIEKKLNIKK